MWRFWHVCLNFSQICSAKRSHGWSNRWKTVKIVDAYCVLTYMSPISKWSPGYKTKHNEHFIMTFLNCNFWNHWSTKAPNGPLVILTHMLECFYKWFGKEVSWTITWRENSETNWNPLYVTMYVPKPKMDSWVQKKDHNELFIVIFLIFLFENINQQRPKIGLWSFLHTCLNCSQNYSTQFCKEVSWIVIWTENRENSWGTLHITMDVPKPITESCV